MNRQIVYPGAIPLETDLLNTNKYTMIALAKLASAIMGSSTYVRGLACTPTSPASMVVNVAAGEIYSLANIDGTAYSSLAADTTHSILKQGYVLDAQSFTLTAPSTSGYSINYLIQVTYADTDGGSTVLPYYNASNPSTAWSGPNKSGTSQYTVRQGLCTVSLKAGVAATTGTQKTPSPDTGYTGLYVITVAQGATTVTAANIAVYANAPFIPSTGLVDGIQRKVMTYAADTGTANAYAAQYVPALLSVTDGTEVEFKARAANTGASTFNPNGLGASPILTLGGNALKGGEIPAGSQVRVKWNATLSSWLIVSASGITVAQTLANLHLIGGLASDVVGRLIGVRVYTASTAYVETEGTKKVLAIITGGGGGGGSCQASSTANTFSGAGGGAAGTCIGLFNLSDITNKAITIGAGGIGQTDGGNTTFAGMVAGGGAKGNWATSTSTPGGGSGTATGGILNIPGGMGNDGQAGAYLINGSGGGSLWGSGGRSGQGGGVGAPAYGAGGGGAYDTAFTNTTYQGGNGAPGVALILEFA